MEYLRNYILKRENDKPILIDAFYNNTIDNQPIAIFCHGYKGFKDWGPWNMMCQRLAEKGLCVIKFNFSHNGGTIEQPIDFPDLEAFGLNNYTKELDDLNDVISWVQNQFSGNPLIDIDSINLIGHSRGGGIVLLKAYEDERIKRVVTLAGVSDFEVRFGKPEELAVWKRDGVKYVINGRTKQQMPHYYQFYEDFVRNKERLDIKQAVETIEIPFLIIHGDRDTSVQVEEAYNLHKWNPGSQLEIIPTANHVFNTIHPWEQKELSDELKKTVELITDFIQ